MLDWSVVLTSAGTLIVGFGTGGYIAWIRFYKKDKADINHTNAETEKIEAEAESTISKSWSELANKFGEELDKSKKESSIIKEESISLRKEMEQMQIDFKEMLELAINEERHECDSKMKVMRDDYVKRESLMQEMFTSHLSKLKEEIEKLKPNI